MACVAVAVSGGIDSLCALLALKRGRHELLAIHGLFKPDAVAPPALADVCAKVGVELKIVDLRAAFAQDVIGYFEKSSAAGLTPNPCAICNQKIKFGALLDAALALGADFLATGHYARFESPGFFYPARDAAKDQAYFLSLVPGTRLKSALFPLHGQTKAETRAIVAKLGYESPVQKESQDVCFLDKAGLISTDQESGPVLLRQPGQESAPLEELAEIGRHKGLANYTIGQRKGLGIAWREPLHVRERRGNCLVVAPRSLLDMTACAVGRINYFLPHQAWPARIRARFRYRQKLCPIEAENRGDGIEIRLLEPRLATAPGQIAAIYDDSGRILAGGIIEKVAIS